MRGLGGTVGVLAIVGASLTSCSYGVYDGSAGDVSEVMQLAFTPGMPASGASPDGFLEVELPPDAFAKATVVHVTRLADRSTPTLFYPVFVLAADTPLVTTMGLVFPSNAPIGADANRFVVGSIDGATFTPLPVTGTRQGSNWGIASSLGTFSVDLRPITAYERSPLAATCFEQCCSGSPGTNDALPGATTSGCFCQQGGGGGGGGPGAQTAPPDLACFIACSKTAPDAGRCVERASSTGMVECPNGGGSMQRTCMPMTASAPVAPVCCVLQNGVGICGTSVGCQSPLELRRCSSKANCGARYCCRFDDEKELRCAADCPEARRVGGS